MSDERRYVLVEMERCPKCGGGGGHCLVCFGRGEYLVDSRELTAVEYASFAIQAGAVPEKAGAE